MSTTFQSWPGGNRHAMHQSDHESWNTKHYPGTLQLCCSCEEPTGRCEEDSMNKDDDTGPYCESCFQQPTTAKETK